MKRTAVLPLLLLTVMFAVLLPSVPAAAVTGAAPSVVRADTTPDFADQALYQALPGGQWKVCVGGKCPHAPATSIAVNVSQSCAVTGGTIWCWNKSRYWQVRTPGKPSAVFVGQAHACAIVGKAKQLWCWGTNHRGELGNGSRTASARPVYTGLKGITTAATAWYTTCAANKAGTAWCWGWNYGPNWGDQRTPKKMDLPPVVSFTSSVSPTICARTNDGLYCSSAGDSETSDLGTQSTATFARKTGPVDAASFNRYFGCIVEAGNVSCWNNSDTPTPIGLSGVSDVAATDTQVCVTADRAIECRDRAGSTLLRTNSSHPFTQVRTGWQTLAIATDGDIWRWTPGYGIHQLTFVPGW